MFPSKIEIIFWDKIQAWYKYIYVCIIEDRVLLFVDAQHLYKSTCRSLTHWVCEDGLIFHWRWSCLRWQQSSFRSCYLWVFYLIRLKQIKCNVKCNSTVWTEWKIKKILTVKRLLFETWWLCLGEIWSIFLHALNWIKEDHQFWSIPQGYLVLISQQ